MSVLDRMKLTGKKAVVTGSAKNLGRSFAEALASVGADVCIADINGEAARQTAVEIAAQYGVQAISYAVDVSQPAQLANLFAYIEEQLGAVDICVANAGIFQIVKAEETEPETWRRIIDVNMNGAFFTCQAAAKAMIRQGTGGAMVLIASLNAHVAARSPSCAYTVSKGGILTMVRDLAAEWGKHKIRVNCITPGNMDTDILTPEWRNNYQEACEQETVLGRLGRPDELQGALVYLASEAASYTTGAEIVVDGGFIIR